MTRIARAATWLALTAALVATLAYLRDPPWLIQVTSGFGAWREDEGGRRYRWTTRSHASFYLPSNAAQVTLPLRLGLARADGAPVQASLAIDGRTFSTLVLDEPLRWVPVTFTLPQAPAPRRAIRVEVLVSSLIRRPGLGIQVGEPLVHPRAGGTAPVTPRGHP